MIRPKNWRVNSIVGGLVGLIAAYQYIVFLYIILINFFRRTKKWYPFQRSDQS